MISNGFFEVYLYHLCSSVVGEGGGGIVLILMIFFLKGDEGGGREIEEESASPSIFPSSRLNFLLDVSFF